MINWCILSILSMLRPDFLDVCQILYAIADMGFKNFRCNGDHFGTTAHNFFLGIIEHEKIQFLKLQ